jgi:hypothetical protein
LSGLATVYILAGSGRAASRAGEIVWEGRGAARPLAGEEWKIMKRFDRGELRLTVGEAEVAG